MNETRNRILDRLRHGTVQIPGFKSDIDASVEPRIPIRRFDWSREECLQRIQRRIEAVRGEVHQVGEDWPTVLWQILKDKGAANLMYGPGSPIADDLLGAWSDEIGIDLLPYQHPVESIREILFESVAASVTSCRGAIAETGSLVLWPTPEEPRLLSLVPPIHCVLLDASRIRSTFAELLAEQGWSRGMPTNALLISGPSKSADIEQTLAYGVHGPKELIVLVQTGSS